MTAGGACRGPACQATDDGRAAPSTSVHAPASRPGNEAAPIPDAACSRLPGMLFVAPCRAMNPGSDHGLQGTRRHPETLPPNAVTPATPGSTTNQRTINWPRNLQLDWPATAAPASVTMNAPLRPQILRVLQGSAPDVCQPLPVLPDRRS